MNGIATQSLKGEEVRNLTAGDKSINVLLSSSASPQAFLRYCQHQKNVGSGLTITLTMDAFVLRKEKIALLWPRK